MLLHEALRHNFTHKLPYSPEVLNNFKAINYLLSHKNIDLSIPDYTGAQYIHYINNNLETHSSHGGKRVHPGELALKELVKKKMAEQEKTNTQNKTLHYMNYVKKDVQNI